MDLDPFHQINSVDDICTRAFLISQLHEHHSTSLEIMSGNCTLLAILEKFPGFDVFEIYYGMASAEWPSVHAFDAMGGCRGELASCMHGVYGG
jgi:hypothetical protein